MRNREQQVEPDHRAADDGTGRNGHVPSDFRARRCAAAYLLI